MSEKQIDQMLDQAVSGLLKLAAFCFLLQVGVHAHRWWVQW